MYGMTAVLAIFMFIILCVSGLGIWIQNNKRVPEKQPLQKGTLTKKLYRNYTTKVV
ncbi:TPA: hypothetical protein ACSZFQ_14865 [Listeria monocytogenes]|nr:hypothetical protein [Listeria monocytogenes]UCK62053.1 hypothetical protein pLIS200121c [Listeria innocua]EHX3562294.1 hypothetical protein [Listeria monocytogenes]EIT8617688.1 hypothetical protein [Listeria monocytogenes]UCZ49956.1 hypothetical protein pLIS37_00121c [Listeria innocua]